MGLSFNLPLYSGGATNSQVKQAQYNFVGASEATDSAHRGVVQNVRSSFNNISAAISSVSAYKQAVVSAQSSWMPPGRLSGGHPYHRRCIECHHGAVQRQAEPANARYDYLISQLNIKYALGTLNQNDLLMLNGDLSKTVPTAADSIAPDDAARAAKANGPIPGGGVR